MATLNLSFDDLAAVICLAAHLANADGDVSDSEMEAIVKAITDQYNFEGRGDLLNEYIQAGVNMSPQEALQHIAAFGPVEKQWTSNFFVKTIIADGNLEENEKSLYWDIQEKCGLPDHNLEGGSAAAAQDDDDDERSLDRQTCITVNFKKVHQDICDGSVNYVQYESGTNVRPKVFEWFNDAPSLQFHRRSGNIDFLNQKLGLGGGWKLIMVYAKADYWANPKPNRVGTVVAGEPVYGPVFFVLENGDKALMGFNYKSFIKKFLLCLNDLDKSIMVQGEENPELSGRYLVTAISALETLEEK